MELADQGRPSFFISYVHDSSEEDNYVYRFHDDLVREVRVHGGPQSFGFSDKLLSLGDRWSPRLIEAISTCSVFIALCSANYFDSPPCGREWAFFMRRLGSLPRLSVPILPLIWVPMRTVPDIMEPYQYSEPGLGDLYREHGLRHLLHIRRHDDDYKQFVTALARRILRLQDSALPPSAERPDFDSLESAFAGPAARVAPAPLPSEPRFESPAPRPRRPVPGTTVGGARPAPSSGKTAKAAASAAPVSDEGGRVVTFYSYKGGTGRTMALANVAWLLAGNGFRVLTVDWDLESPGLHRYFHPFLRDKELRHTDGVLDLMRNYADHVSNGRPDARDDLARIQEWAVSLDWEFPRGGVLDFVAAGRQDNSYATKVSTFDWDTLWTRLGGGPFIERLRQDMRDHYDFVLIDSRTGTSDTAGICTIQLPHVVVNCFTLNKQSIDGAAAITNVVLHQSADTVTVYPIPTRIEDGEKAKLERGRSYSRRRFDPYLKFLGDEQAADYWNSVEIPYIPYYAYEEILASFGDQPGVENSLLSRYERLAGRISGGACPAPRFTEAQRNRVRRLFEQAAPAAPAAVIVAYAPLDRIWAEWLRDRLTGPAYHVSLYCVDQPLPSLEEADRLVVIHSRAYAGTGAGTRLLRRAAEQISAGDGQFAAILRVDGMPVGDNAPARSVIDVMGVAEDRALAALGSVLELEPIEPAGGDRPGAIRYPAAPAPQWNVPLVRNPRFSGRGELLEHLRDALLGAGPEGGRVALTGLAGVGKTQVAVEYAYRFASAYDLVQWVSARPPGAARQAFADLGDDLGLSPRADLDAQLAAVRAELGRGARRWLLIYDNTDDIDQLEALVPGEAGHVLVTSRNPRAADRFPAIEVGVMSRAESIELLGRRVAGISPADADRLAARLGDLPVALEQAGGWLASTGMQVEDYLALFDRSAADVAAAMNENAPPDYPGAITSTVQLAYGELRERHPAAARLLELMAFLAPEAIPFRLLSNRRLTEVLTLFDPTMRDWMHHATVNREIGRYGLARVDAGSGGVVVHRLTQDIVRSRLSAEEQRQRRDELLAVLAEANPGDPGDRRHWRAYEALRPHVESSGAPESERADVRQLIVDMVSYLWQRGDLAGGEDLARRALREWRGRSGEDDDWTLQLMYHLAILVRDQGREREAYEINRDGYERLARSLGKSDAYTLRMAVSLAVDLRARGDYHEALELAEEAVRGLRSALGDEDPLTLIAVENLGTSRRLQGDFEAAAALDRDTLERRSRLLGALAPDTLGSGEHYGVDLRELGDLEGAQRRLDDTYVKMREVLGEDHPRTIRTGKAYAVTLRRLGLLDAAAAVMENVERGATTVLGATNAVTLSVQLERACLDWAHGDHARAVTAGRTVEADCRRRFGEHHPYTSAVWNDLSIFLRAGGDVGAARRLAERAADRFGTLLGPRHPHTLAAQVTLANAINAAEPGSDEALRLDASALERLESVLPGDHPSVLAAAVNFVLSHGGTDPAAARRIRARTVDQIPVGYPYAEAVRAGRRIDLDIELPFV
ncbi:FxSxx-COOH system tetratricopeptide repeat protein [Dactylosporangium sp. CS-033363]|uniref:FxSxx-COOH system tetratricopeptide repeat protein n=1 Tax=Dactylosporangium sp. CS-033363 TaxID=3239935 RepID=UPI003D8F1C7C